MRDESDPYGPRLMHYVDGQLSKMQGSATAFAVEQAGISASQFGRWRDGSSQPRLDAIVRIAEALGRPVLEVLAHTVGAVDQLLTAPPAPAPTLDDALKASGLSEWSQATLLDFVAALRRADSGTPDVSATNKKGRGKK